MHPSKIFLLIVLHILFFNIALGIAKAQDYIPSQILIKFRGGAGDAFINIFASQYNLTLERKLPAGKKINYFLFALNSNESVTEKISEIKKDRRVKTVQPNYIFRSAGRDIACYVPTKKKSRQDHYYPRQWWVYNSGQLGSIGCDLNLLNVWNQEQPSWPGVVIGIIDSGLNQKHKDLKKNIVRGYDFVHDKKKKMRDREGHGSFIAGLIASEVNNRRGIAGMSRLNKLKVMPLKFDFSTEEAVSAIAYASVRGVRILNMSWGTNEFDQALYDAIKGFNGLAITAAGNGDDNGVGLEHNDNTHFYPCDFDLENIICAGASSENDTITSYSDWSATSVDLLAPGGENAPIIGLDTKNNRYTTEVGSSFSAAFVSGAAGLVLSANPSVGNLEIKDLILNNVRKKDELASKVLTGGVLDVEAAVNRKNPE